MADPLDLPRIKRNISKMIDLGAPKADIDRYLAEEGTTPEAIRGAPLHAPAPDRISGAFEAAQPVRQVDKLVEPRRGLLTSRNRLGDVSFIPPALQDLYGATETVGGVLRGDIPAMVPDTGQGVTNPQVESAAKTIGAAALPVNPAFRAGDLAVPGMVRAPLRKAAPKIPTREELYQVGDAGYDRARHMGVDYNPNFVADLAAQTQAALDRDGFRVKNAPNTLGVLRDLQRIPKTGPGERSIVQLDDLETARKALRRIPKGPDYNQDREAARRVIAAIDQFAEEPPAAGVVAGPADFQRAQQSAGNGVLGNTPGAGRGDFAQQAQQIAEARARQAGAIQKEARANWAAMERSKEVAGKQKYAQWRAWASNSGANIDNNLRNRVTDLLIDIDKGRIKGFSKAEQDELIGFVKGSKTRNFSRKVANLLGGGGGLGALLTGGVAGAYYGMPGALALPVVGVGTKVAENALARSAMRKLDETVRKRSPLFDQRLALSPSAPLTAEARAAALRTLMAGGPSPLTVYLNANERDRFRGGPLFR
jgi:hypothetical protein